MLAEFVRPDAPDQVVARASWDGRTVHVDDVKPDVEAALKRIFRATPVVVDDASLRTLGTNGTSTLEPGALDWFIAAARTRAEREGLRARLVPTAHNGIGWDPAGAYRTFHQAVQRRDGLDPAGLAGR